MGRNFDSIDIIFILLISTYLVVLFVFVLWLILSKLEKYEIEKKGSSFLSSNSKRELILEKPVSKPTINNEKTEKKKIKESKKIEEKQNKTKVIPKQTVKLNDKVDKPSSNKNNNTTKQKNSNNNKIKQNNNTKVKTTIVKKKTTKKKNNSSNRNNGYVSPTKRKKNNKKRK